MQISEFDEHALIIDADISTHRHKVTRARRETASFAKAARCSPHSRMASNRGSIHCGRKARVPFVALLYRKKVTTMDFIVALLVGGVGAITAVILAQRKNRHVALWCLVCFLFPLALLPLFALSPLPQADEAGEAGKSEDSSESV